MTDSLFGAESATAPDPSSEASVPSHGALDSQPLAVWAAAAGLPLIGSLSKRSGSVLGGTRVELQGTGFVEGTVVKVDGVAVPTEYRSPTELAFVTLPRNVPGPVDVSVVNPDGKSTFIIFGFSYCPPVRLIAVTPNRAPIRGGTTVRLTGEQFVGGCRVRIGASFPRVCGVDGEGVVVVIDPHPAGVFDVEIINPDGATAVLPRAFSYDPAPEILDVVPCCGPQSGGATVRILGQGFLPGCGVSFFGIPARVSFLSERELCVLSPPRAAAGPVPVEVLNPNGLTALWSRAYNYDLDPPPKIDGVYPAMGPIGAATPIRITGEHFREGCLVLVGGQVVPVRTHSSTVLETVVPPSTRAGRVSIEIRNIDRQRAEISAAFEYQGPPTLSSASPSEGTDAGGLVLTVRGNGFVPGCVAALGGADAVCHWISSSELRVTTPHRGSAGCVDLHVINPDGLRGVLARAFSYVMRHPPKIQSVVPTTGPVSGGSRIAVLGEHLERVTSVICGAIAVGVAERHPGEIQFVLPPRQQEGLVDIELRTQDGLAGMRKLAFRYDPVARARR